MACTLSNKCAKNLSKRTVLLQLIIKNVVTCFFGTQCTTIEYRNVTDRQTDRIAVPISRVGMLTRDKIIVKKSTATFYCIPVYAHYDYKCAVDIHNV